MITYLISYLLMSASTRRRIGKSKTTRIDVDDRVTPVMIETTFERTRNAVNKSVVTKVFDVRKVE